jgi:hypothetical protein
MKASRNEGQPRMLSVVIHNIRFEIRGGRLGFELAGFASKVLSMSSHSFASKVQKLGE